MRATADAVRADLCGRTGGIYRYVGDTYYGGGEWILLTAWIGWYDAVTGNTDGVRAARDWIRRAATTGLDLPEQTIDGAQDPAMVESWVNRWGPVATPLLWSHAMYLIMSAAPASI
jgi:GH15 family glucan-1,4-alpha-glucosidase